MLPVISFVLTNAYILFFNVYFMTYQRCYILSMYNLYVFPEDGQFFLKFQLIYGPEWCIVIQNLISTHQQ